MQTNIKLLFTHLNSKCQNDSRNKNKMKGSHCHCCYSQGRREWPRAATDVCKDTSPPIVKISRFTHNYSTEFLKISSSLQFGSSISCTVETRQHSSRYSTARLPYVFRWPPLDVRGGREGRACVVMYLFYPLPRGHTDAYENITFPQFRDSHRVPTRPGKPGKMRVHLEISWNFKKFNKYHGKMT